MKENQVYYEVGAYRQSRDRKVDKGRDGVLFMPSRPSSPAVAAVADGIGFDGCGREALGDLQEILTSVEGLREAVFQLLDFEHASTFVGMQLPRTFDEPARIISLGDSFAFLSRKSGVSGRVHQLLNEVNNLWNDTKRGNHRLEELHRKMQSGQLPKRKLDEIFLALRPCYVAQNGYSVDLLLGGYRDHYLQTEDPKICQKILLQMIDRADQVITLDLASPERQVQKVMGSVEKSLRLKPGDDIVLHTDGMDLQPGAIGLILDECHPIGAAKKMVQTSQKSDDRAVVVIRLGDQPVQQRIRRPLLKSLRNPPQRKVRAS